MALSSPIIGKIPLPNPITGQVANDLNLIDKPYSQVNTKQSFAELVLYTLSPTNEGTFYEYVTEDFVLTYISSHVEGGSITTKNHTLYLNDVPITMMEAQPATAEDVLLTFPGVIVRKGSVIKLLATESGGAQSLKCLHSFIGYRF